MAHVYVNSLAAGAGTGADWANAYTTLAAALTAKAAGDNFWVGHAHAETQASAMTMTSPGTAASPCTVICVDTAGTVPPVSADIRTTATVTTTGANAMTIGAGHTYWSGLTLAAGTGATTVGITCGAAGYNYFKNCKLQKLGTSAAILAFRMGGTDVGSITNTIILDNTTVKFGSTGDSINFGGSFPVWKNTVAALDVAGAMPTGMIRMNRPTLLLCDGMDFSGVTTTLIWQAATQEAAIATLKNCKLHATAAVCAAGTQLDCAEAHVIRSDSAGTNYRHERVGGYTGSQVVETTIVRTGGASDGTTPLAWKIVTTTNSEWVMPFECFQITIWNDTVGSSITVTLYGIWGGGAVPTNADIWMDVAYLGSSATPVASFATSGKTDFLAAATNLTADSSTWGGSTTKFKMSASFTPQMEGPITITPRAALPSSTFYIDPKPEISGVTVSKSLILSPGVYANEIGAAAAGGQRVIGG